MSWTNITVSPLKINFLVSSTNEYLYHLSSSPYQKSGSHSWSSTSTLNLQRLLVFISLIYLKTTHFYSSSLPHVATTSSNSLLTNLPTSVLVPLIPSMYSSQNDFGTSRSLFHIQFSVSLWVSFKKASWDFDWDSIESIDQFGENWHVNSESSSSWTWYLS